MYSDFKFKNYKQTNHKIRQLREMVDRLYGDYEYKKNLISELNSQLKIKINLPSEANLPDLTITNITSIDKGHYFEFTITIKNIGEIATTEETNLVITIEGEDVELIVPALAVDATVDRYASFPYDPDAVNTYSLNVNSEVNQERNIEESDYSNNIKSQSFNIKNNYGTGYISHVHNEEGIEFNSLISQWYQPLSGELIASPLGYSAFAEGDHNSFASYIAGAFDIGVKHRYSNIQRALTTMTIVEGICTIVTMILQRVSTQVFLDHTDDFGGGYILYYYRFLKYHTDGTPFGLQGGVPLGIQDAGEYWEAIFESSQSLIANNVPYDLTGTGVRG